VEVLEDVGLVESSVLLGLRSSSDLQQLGIEKKRMALDSIQQVFLSSSGRLRHFQLASAFVVRHAPSKWACEVETCHAFGVVVLRALRGPAAYGASALRIALH
jgi:hypothetical protein